jgi:hypothetical protein
MSRRPRLSALLQVVLVGILATGCVADVRAQAVAPGSRLVGSTAFLHPGGGLYCQVMGRSMAAMTVGAGGADPQP